jgi:DNA polymerase I-like protein with 3'-5' exonuclease and polymerase domains
VEQINCTLDEAKGFFSAYDKALPEFKQLSIDVEKSVRSGVKIRTWGGRLYDVEPPFILPNGKVLEKYYKLSNTLIQGSSADMTKAAMIRYDAHPERKGNLILQVHDELVASVKHEHLHTEMAILRWAMEEQPNWDVPIRSSGEWGHNYGEMKKYEDRGQPEMAGEELELQRSFRF